MSSHTPLTPARPTDGSEGGLGLKSRVPASLRTFRMMAVSRSTVRRGRRGARAELLPRPQPVARPLLFPFLLQVGLCAFSGSWHAWAAGHSWLTWEFLSGGALASRGSDIMHLLSSHGPPSGKGFLQRKDWPSRSGALVLPGSNLGLGAACRSPSLRPGWSSSASVSTQTSYCGVGVGSTGSGGGGTPEGRQRLGRCSVNVA